VNSSHGRHATVDDPLFHPWLSCPAGVSFCGCSPFEGFRGIEGKGIGRRPYAGSPCGGGCMERLR
jgi:hypothetical protein